MQAASKELQRAAFHQQALLPCGPKKSSVHMKELAYRLVLWWIKLGVMPEILWLYLACGILDCNEEIFPPLDTMLRYSAGCTSCSASIQIGRLQCAGGGMGLS